MKKTAQKIRSTTQAFTEIQDIKESVVLLSFGNACSIIEVKATNFALLSQDEQRAKMSSYATLLNSLSFPIQILIQSKKLDISSYLKLLDEEAKKTQDSNLSNQIGLYRNFVADLVKKNVVLDKKFYIVIPYSSLETNTLHVPSNRQKGEEFFALAKTNLASKAESLHAQLTRMNLPAKTLGKEELIKLFYEFYNGDAIEGHSGETRIPMVKGSA